MIGPREIYDAIDAFAPFETAEDFDNVGILVDCGNKTEKILFALDITEETVMEAKARSCGVLVSHHPTMFGGVKSLNFRDPALIAAREGVSLVAAHTNYDAAPGGINDVLAGLLELGTVGSFCRGLGRIGLLKEKLSPRRFADYIKERLGVASVALVPGERDIQTVAVGGGSYEFVLPALEAGADALVTGELKHHQGLEARQLGLTAVAAGHFATENPGMIAMRDYLQKVLGDEIECLYSEKGMDPFISY